MTREPFAETELYTIRWDSELAAVVIEWHTFARGEQFREGMERVLECIEAWDATKELADARELGVILDDDLEWLGREWDSRAAAAGLKCCAVAHADSMVATTQHERLAGDDGRRLDALFTDDLSEARTWLADQ